MAMMAVGATGCKSVCKANKDAGLATIVCQPMNQTVGDKDTAAFEVKACGRELEYQWYYNDGTKPIPLEDTNGFCGAHRSQLFISNVTNHVGHYSCRIVSYDVEENPAVTETRMATLGFIRTSKKAMSLNIIDHQPPPPGSSGTSSCGPYGAFLLFDNTNHAGYKPTAGQQVGFVKVKYSNSLTYLQTSTYELLWKTGVLEKGCATNYTDTQKTFPCNASKYYKFIVYFKTWPPAPGSGDVVLDLTF